MTPTEQDKEYPMTLDDRLDLIPGDWRIYFEPTKEAKQAILSDLLEIIRTNRKGQFEDDGGNLCWYLDDLIKAVKEYCK